MGGNTSKSCGQAGHTPVETTAEGFSVCDKCVSKLESSWTKRCGECRKLTENPQYILKFHVAWPYRGRYLDLNISKRYLPVYCKNCVMKIEPREYGLPSRR